MRTTFITIAALAGEDDVARDGPGERQDALEDGVVIGVDLHSVSVPLAAATSFT